MHFSQQKNTRSSKWGPMAQAPRHFWGGPGGHTPRPRGQGALLCTPEPGLWQPAQRGATNQLSCTKKPGQTSVSCSQSYAQGSEVLLESLVNIQGWRMNIRKRKPDRTQPAATVAARRPPLCSLGRRGGSDSCFQNARCVRVQPRGPHSCVPRLCPHATHDAVLSKDRVPAGPPQPLGHSP